MNINKKIIAILEFIIGISAIRGGYGLITSKLNIPLELLNNTPFNSYFWPGLILASLVGGAYLFAAIMVWNEKKFYHEASALAGFTLVIWLFTEMYLIKESNFLQVLYFILAIGTLLITMISLKFQKNNKYV